MKRRLTYANVTSTLVILAMALPASALAAKNTLGEDRAAINRSAAHLAKVYKELWGEPLKWEVQQCLPHGPTGKRVDHLLCAVETRETYSFVVATNRRNRLPSGYFLAAEYGQIDVYVTKPKPLHRTYRVPSGSMEPTLKVGQLVDVAPLVSMPQIGDIVVFHPPKAAERVECGRSPHVIKVGGAACAEPVPVESETLFIKRIVAGPGDQIYIKEGQVWRKAANGASFEQESGSYIKPCVERTECNFRVPITIPADHWFVLGDNRGESDDSRFWGPVPTGWLVGVAD